MGWRIIYIENATSIKLNLDNLHITNDLGELTIPLHDIHTLILDSYRMAITMPLLVKCCSYNINVVFCDIEHMPCGTISTLYGNFQSPKILNKQICWDTKIKEKLHSKIIKNKIENQSDLLKKLNKSMEVYGLLHTYANTIVDGDKTNREGLAAKSYFRELFGKKFIRFEEDAINAGLNYGYSILRTQISKTIVAKGLHPSLGIFHIGACNQFNLSDDIIEVFRPLVDYYVYNNMLDNLFLTKKNRIELVELTGKDVMFDGKKHTLFNAIKLYIEKIMEIFESGIVDDYIPIRLIYEL